MTLGKSEIKKSQIQSLYCSKNGNKIMTAIVSYQYQILLDLQDAFDNFDETFVLHICLHFAPLKYCRYKFPVAQKSSRRMEIQRGVEGILSDSPYTPFCFRGRDRQKLYRMLGQTSYCEAGRIHCFDGEAYYRPRPLLKKPLGSFIL